MPSFLGASLALSPSDGIWLGKSPHLLSSEKGRNYLSHGRKEKRQVVHVLGFVAVTKQRNNLKQERFSLVIWLNIVIMVAFKHIATFY